MGRLVALGERARIAGFVLTGAETVTVPVDDPAAVVAAWHALGGDVDVVVLTPASAAALGDLLEVAPRPGRPLHVVLPEVVW